MSNNNNRSLHVLLSIHEDLLLKRTLIYDVKRSTCKKYNHVSNHFKINNKSQGENSSLLC